MRRLFALDHNVPHPVLAALADALPQAELVPVRDIDPSFADLADWELLTSLYRHPRRWDGLITNDDAMLSLPKEMTVLSQTGLTLVVAKGEGHNPIRAGSTSATQRSSSPARRSTSSSSGPVVRRWRTSQRRRSWSKASSATGRPITSGSRTGASLAPRVSCPGRRIHRASRRGSIDEAMEAVRLGKRDAAERPARSAGTMPMAGSPPHAR